MLTDPTAPRRRGATRVGSPQSPEEPCAAPGDNSPATTPALLQMAWPWLGLSAVTAATDWPSNEIKGSRLAELRPAQGLKCRQELRTEELCALSRSQCPPLTGTVHMVWPSTFPTTALQHTGFLRALPWPKPVTAAAGPLHRHCLYQEVFPSEQAPT